MSNRMKVAVFGLVTAAAVSAGSIWNYTFTDYFCQTCAPVGFSFSKPAPLEIAPGQNLWVPGAEFTACDTINPALYCQGADLYWRSPGMLQVNFSRQYSYPADWDLSVEAQFAIPALSAEGTYTNELRYSGLVETQIFSIIDPPANDTAPEPNGFWLLLLGAGLSIALSVVQRGAVDSPFWRFCRFERIKNQ